MIATCDGWDQRRGDERLLVLPGRRARRRRAEAEEEEEDGTVRGRDRSVFRFKQKPFFDSSGRYCFHFMVGFPLYLVDGSLWVIFLPVLRLHGSTMAAPRPLS